MGTERPRALTVQDLNSDLFDRKLFREMSFADFLVFAQENPQVCHSAHQRLYQAVIRCGVGRFRIGSAEYQHYNFFDDPLNNGTDAVYGLDRHVARLVEVLQAAAARQGQEKRIILLYGPVGSAKSTILRLLRRGLERHTRTDEGQLYTFCWTPRNDYDRELMGLSGSKDSEAPCPIHEDPLMLLPLDVRHQLTSRLNEGVEKPEEEIVIEGSLCQFCRFVYRGLEKKYKDTKEPWKEIVSNHVQVRRLIFSEVDRLGIGSFRPKDEKNQDSMELSGDINWRKVGECGSESDPRAFNFDGEFFVANRGFFGWEEIFKSALAFLYDCLGVSQEKRVKPKRLAEADVDIVLIGTTNNPEYDKMRGDETMQALFDRTTPCCVPYVLRLRSEQSIYRSKTYGRNEGNPPPAGWKHLAPHTIKMASFWAILTRLSPTPTLGLNEKVDLYDGKTIPGFGEEKLLEVVSGSPDEGIKGISPRFIQDMLGQAAVKQLKAGGTEESVEQKAQNACADWFAVRENIERGLGNHPLVQKQDRDRFKELLADVNAEFDRVVQGEVQQAIAADENALTTLYDNYINQVLHFVSKERIKDPHRGYVPPNEELMAEIENLMGIEPQGRENHRRTLMQRIGAQAVGGETFNFQSDERLLKALRLKLFNDAKDKIKLSCLVSGVVDKDEQEKIDVVKARLIRQFGYCDVCAVTILNYVAGIFARGSGSEQKRKR